MTAASPFPSNRTERSQSAHALQRSQLSSGIAVAGAIALICVVAAALALFDHVSAHVLREVLAGVACGTLILFVVALVAARAASRRVDAELRAARQIAQRGQAELQQMTDRVMRGERPGPPVTAPARVTGGDPFRVLAGDIEQAQFQAAQGVLLVADKVYGGGRTDQRVEIFVNLARRMQSLVHREIEMLDDLEAKVEDPELLKGLFTVDHLATRLRRQSESLAVLGGSSSRRQWTRQVTMHEVLRAAVAEVEQYSRVKVVPPVEGVLRGAAVTDVIHLIAELVENATKFSAPHTIALLRVQHVAAGVAVEVEDRGLGMLASDQQRMNGLLADPTRMDVDELLRDGRIGLYVVAALARRHGIRVQLQNNIYGGTQAVVVLPKALLDLVDDRSLPSAAADERDSGPRPALAQAAASAGGRPDGRPDGWPTAGEQTAWTPPAGRTAPGPSSPPAPWAAVRSPDGAPETSARPPLPKRQPQASAVLPAQDRPAGQHGDAATARGAEPPADQMTGLMADFLRGVRSAEEGDPSGRD
ncbi:MAG TPA: ATP-binding protein [Trebonia sp.]|jgi:signal transduction histidine kinase